MNIPRPIDAELVTLLHEITDDPSQLLAGFTKRLRDTKHELPKTLALDEDNFFNQSERRMLRRHREEIGDLLHKRCVYFLQKKPFEESLISWTNQEDGAGQLKELANEAAWKKRDDIAGRRELEQFIRKDIDKENLLAASELAVRLFPGFAQKTTLGMALLDSEKASSALDVFRSQGKQRLTTDQFSIATANEAFSYCELGDLDAARIRYMKSYKGNHSRVIVAVGWTILELCCGQSGGMLESANELQMADKVDEHGFGNAQFEEYLVAIRNPSARYHQNIRDNQLEKIAAMADSLPARARKLANAIIQKQ